MESAENRLNELQERLFLLQMKDYWTDEDYDRSAKLNAEIIKIKKEMR